MEFRPGPKTESEDRHIGYQDRNVAQMRWDCCETRWVYRSSLFEGYPEWRTQSDAPLPSEHLTLGRACGLDLGEWAHPICIQAISHRSQRHVTSQPLSSAPSASSAHYASETSERRQRKAGGDTGEMASVRESVILPTVTGPRPPAPRPPTCSPQTSNIRTARTWQGIYFTILEIQNAKVKRHNFSNK